MTALALALADWAHGLQPDQDDLTLASRSLADTVAVTLAARDHPVTRLAAALPDGARWAVAGHVLDFDDLHMASTAKPTCSALASVPNARCTPPAPGTASASAVAICPAVSPSPIPAPAALASAPAVQVACQPAE